MEYLFLITVVSSIVVYWTYRLINLEPPYCEDCNEKMVLKTIEDPTGFNIAPKTTFSLWTGPAKIIREYECSCCEKTTTKTVWE